MTINKFFTVAAMALFTIVSNPVSAQNEGVELLENKGYDQLATLKQTERLGNTYNRYLKRTDKETGEVERWLLSSKPLTGPAAKVTLEGYVYDKAFTPLPMIGFAWVGSYLIPEVEFGIGRSIYKDPESNLYEEGYYSVVARGDILWKCYRSSAKDQMLEKWYIALGPGVEYNNRRNSFATTTETQTEVTETIDKVQGSSYGIFGKVEVGVNFPKSGLTLAVNAHFGTGRDYRGDGTISCTRYGGGVTLRYVFSKTKYTKLGKLQKENPAKFKQILNAY